MPVSPPRYPARATLDLPLPAALRRLSEMANATQPGGPAERFGREFLGLDASAMEEWFPRAWWGHYAINACWLRFLRPERRQEVLAILPDPDWSPLKEQARRGLGVIVPLGHLGVPHLLGYVLWQAGSPALRINFSELFQHPSVDTRRIDQPDYLARLQVRALFHLREGGIVCSNPDGGPGRKATEAEFFGRRVRIPRATATMARISGAPCLPCVTRWAGHELAFEFGEPFQPQAEDAEEWELEWNHLYLRWLESIYRAHPDNTWFGNGLLKEFLQGAG